MQCSIQSSKDNSLCRRLCLLLTSDCLDHVRLVAALSARPWVHVLEALKLEFCLGLGWRHLLPDSVVSVDLSIGHSDANGALALRTLIVKVDTNSLEQRRNSSSRARWCSSYEGAENMLNLPVASNLRIVRGGTSQTSHQIGFP